MEEPFRQPAGACARETIIRALGMKFLANAILLQADRLFRLYHGHAPKYNARRSRSYL